MLANYLTSSTETTRTSGGGKGSRILEVEELTEWRYGGLGNLGISFFLFLLLGPGPVQMTSARVLLPPESSQLEVEFPRALEGHPGRYCSVVGLMRSYERVCGLFPCFLLVLSSPGVLP